MGDQLNELTHSEFVFQRFDLSGAKIAFVASLEMSRQAAYSQDDRWLIVVVTHLRISR